MSGLALLLVMVGAFTHASWNVAAKRSSSSGPPFIWLAGIVSLLAVAPFAIVRLAGTDHRPEVLLLGGGISGGIHAGYFLLLQRGYRSGDVSLVYPLARGTGPLLTMIGSLTIFAERPSVISLVGALVILAGVAVIGFVGTRGVHFDPAAVGFGLATGLTIACYTMWDSYSVTRLGISPVVQNGISTLIEVLVIAPLVLGRPAAIKGTVSRYAWPVIIVGIGSPLAYISVLYAMRLAPTALVAPGREASVVLVGLAGWLLLGERNPRPRLAGAGIVLVGIVLLALG
jgi:drug/metabolite transporter (DMT)-like permease